MPSVSDAQSASFYSSLAPDLASSCATLQKSFSLSPLELYYKIESFQIERNIDPGVVSQTLLEDLRLQLQENLERKQQQHQQQHRQSSSPVAGGVTPLKRKFAGNGQTHTPLRSSPLSDTTFAARSDAGRVMETLNPAIQISKPSIPEDRARITAFMDTKKYQYRTMRQALLEASEFLDERIEAFGELVQTHLREQLLGGDKKCEDPVLLAAIERLASPNAVSHEDVVVVGRIVSDSVHAADSARLNEKSMLLECSRRMGSGVRVPLKFALSPASSSSSSSSDASAAITMSGPVSFFPGQIVALRGSNPSGSEFVVKAILKMPELAYPVSPISTLRTTASGPTRMMVAKGPFTTQDNLEFAPLAALVDSAISSNVDVVVLLGPFVDVLHPRLNDPAALPAQGIATLEDLFRTCVSQHLRRLEAASPNCQILLVPDCGAREAVQRHLSFPVPPVTGGAETKKQLGLPRRAKWLSNPAFVAVNSSVLAIANVDVLMQMSKVEHIVRVPNPASSTPGSQGEEFERSAMVRGVRNLMLQRSLYPVFPSDPATPLEVSYLGLADMNIARPDILIVPSAQRYFAKVVDNVVAINPGPLTMMKAAGTYAVVDIAGMDAQALQNVEERDGETASTTHDIWNRCKVEIRKI
ncbi:DNA polymerase alpha subunit B N-terminal-domain-containing protein [Myxozyma melibiosi]|uniref:DNA polymerase alpha subunit B n=1 Tax=Myxozyma melibiosi TaxID=54550 RepID=A0ABR1F8F3_9ASCO